MDEIILWVSYRLLIFIVCIIASGILYRMGGAAGYNTKYRDWGCPTMALVAMWALGLWNVWLILCWFLLWAALSTYYDELAELFADPDLWTWIFVGVGFGLAMLPYAITTGNWLGFIVRFVALTIAVVWWSTHFGNDVEEELGRGGLLIGSLSLLGW